MAKTDDPALAVATKSGSGRLSFGGEVQRVGMAVGEDYEPSKAATQPTSFAPGSDGKLNEMVRRMERGEPLWHPADPVNLRAMSQAAAATEAWSDDARSMGATA